MFWIAVKVDVAGVGPVDNTINVETITRFGPRPKGSYVKLVDGSTVELVDSYEELIIEISKTVGR